MVYITGMVDRKFDPGKAFENAQRSYNSNVERAFSATPVDALGVMSAYTHYETTLLRLTTKGLDNSKALDQLYTFGVGLAYRLRSHDQQVADALQARGEGYKVMLDKASGAPSRATAQSTPAPMDQAKG